MGIRSIYLFLTYFPLFVIIIWDALKVYLNLGSPIIQFAVLAPVLLVGVSENLNKGFLDILFSRPVSTWLVWIIYSLLNTLVVIDKTYQDNNPIILAFSLFVVLIFILFIVNLNIKTASLLKILIFSYFFRLLLSYIFDSEGAYQRFGSEFNSNSIAFGALFLVGLIFLKKIQFNEIRKIDYFILFIAIYTIFITGSRKNFISLVLLLIGYIYIYRSFSKVKNIFKYSFFLIIIGFSMIWILNNTLTGERLIDSYYKTISHSQSGDKEMMFDSRARYYVHGWQLFKEHPINGIGLRNFQNYDYVNNSLHTEYMSQITEGGLIGTFLFLYFYAYILLRLFKIRKKQNDLKRLTEFYILLLIIMFVLFFGTWIYRTPMMWVFIALAIRFIKEAKQNKIQLVSS